MSEIVFKPFAKQNDFYSLPDSIFEALYGGAAFGGKSDALVMLPLVRKFYEHPKFKGLILRRTFPELDKEIIRRSLGYYPLAGGKYSADSHSWKFPSGAYIDFGHIEHLDDVRKYDSAQYNYIAFDELTSFLEYQYLYLAISRCRSSTPELPAIVRSGSNPDGQGALWVRRRFVDPCKQGMRIIVDEASKAKRIFIPARIVDNPYAAINDAEYVNRLELLPEREKAAKKYGSWDYIIGQAFEEFRLEPFKDEPVNAKHVIKPFDIPKNWPSIVAVDWGWSAKTYALKGYLSPDNRIYITQEYSRKREYIAVTASEIGRRLYGNSRYLFLDPSAWQARGEPKTINEQFAEYSKINPMKADNDRIGGKILLQDCLRWKTRPDFTIVTGEFDADLADRILRVSGMDGYNKYLKSIRNEDVKEDNLPRLQIFDTCKELIETIPQCMIDENNPEDVADFDGDDPYDTLRYLLKGITYLQTQIDPYEKKKIEVQDLFDKGSIDINSYYRRMEALDNKKPSNSVRMH